MWCVNCHADVAAEVSQDNERVQCATCQADLGATEALQASSKTREARELLERWANSDVVDPYGPVVQPAPEVSTGEMPEALEIPVQNIVPPETIKAQPQSENVSESIPTASTTSDRENIPPVTKQQPKFRLDNAHSSKGRSRSYLASPPPKPAVTEPITPQEEVTSDRSGERMFLHQAHRSAPPAPHFDIQKIAEKQNEKTKVSVMSLFGQWMAYIGVLILTGGAAMVISGYFGGPAHFTSTGWLVSTFGQMLLFLGVVTLVSGGMEQTTDEVKKQVEFLANQIINFEQASKEIAQREAASATENTTALRQRIQEQLADINRQLEDRQAS